MRLWQGSPPKNQAILCKIDINNKCILNLEKQSKSRITSIAYCKLTIWSHAHPSLMQYLIK